MHLMYFTEQPMSAYPSGIGLATGHTALMFSNKYFDSAAGSRLYNEFLEHYIMCDELGFDGIIIAFSSLHSFRLGAKRRAPMSPP